MNKVEKPQKKENKKEAPKEDKKVNEKIKDLPSKNEQEQMNKMFELLVKPEIKKKAQSNIDNTETKGYEKSDIDDLNELISDAAE